MRVPLGGDSQESTCTVRVNSSDGVTAYIVCCLPGGLWTCTCPGFINRGKCRHIRQVRARLMDVARLEGDHP